MEINKSIPIMFQKKNSFETKDTRFTNVTIWLMHMEQNLNGSYFSKEVVDKAIPSLANTPILAYIEINPDDEIDASDHRQVLIKEDGKYKIKYIGQAYGVIPESCNPRYQNRVCDDGVEREFLVIDGLMWTGKFEDIDTILKRDGIKGQSMELDENIDGFVSKEDNLFHFTDFKFYGACILSDFVNPAMRSSTVEVTNFSIDEFKQTINSKMEEFKQYTNKQKGGEMENMTENKIEQIEEVVEQPVTEFTEEVKPTEEFATEIVSTVDSSRVTTETYDEDGYKSQEVSIEVRTVEVKDVPDVVDNENSTETFSEEESVVETVVEDQPKEEFTEEVVESVEEPVVEEKFNVEETEEYKQLLEKYSALESELADLKSKFALSEEENTKLNKFKADKLKEERVSKINEIVSKFSVEGIDIEGVKSDALEEKITMEQLEEKLFAMVGKKHFTEQIVKGEVNEETLKFSLKSTETCPYPSLAHYFTK